ncbi:MAG: OmpA family protein [Saprospiraceae bacterium]
MDKLALIIFNILLLCSMAISQTDSTSIVIINGSFEDKPACCMTPYGWTNCGLPSESEVDVHAAMKVNEKPLFGVKTKPLEGKTYLGMVVRKNNTYEKIGQKLSTPLLQGICYYFSIYLAKSADYNNGFESKSDSFELFDKSTKLRIWGGDIYCNQKEKLGESVVVENTDWNKYEFTFLPKSRITFITLEAYYDTETFFPYNGNLLLDNASNIIIIRCNNKKKFKVGQTIKIDKLYFSSDSATIKPESFKVLDSLLVFLQTNEKLIIEIGGHTNSQPPPQFCYILSEKRAKAVADYLISKGIDQYRVKYKGYGKFSPIVSNSTKEGRLRNQRVEIKILKIE